MPATLPPYKGELTVLKIVETNETFEQHENLVEGMEFDNAPGSFDPDATPACVQKRADASADAFKGVFLKD